MALYQQGDPNAAIALIEALSPMLFRFFLLHPGNQDQAADLLRETWLQVHRSRRTYRVGAPVLPWLYSIARHVQVDANRKLSRTSLRNPAGEIVTGTPTWTSSPVHGPASFASLIRVLPSSQREVMIMLKATGMSLQEIARANATGVGSVKRKAHRACRTLRAVLKHSHSG